ncbi:hypothetical protein, partial [Parasutterella excrementihominis]|uniref:hypothetical protein n=1 Tax=Parasutterella excrementihominis TaxID=487175 RepID=UPI003FEE148C
LRNHALNQLLINWLWKILAWDAKPIFCLVIRRFLFGKLKGPCIPLEDRYGIRTAPRIVIADGFIDLEFRRKN